MTKITKTISQDNSAFRQLFNFNVVRSIGLPLIIYLVYNFLASFLHVESYLSGFKISSMVYSILGLALGLLLVFRTNSAYERWWEGRRLLGVLTNNSRALAMRVENMTPHKDEQIELIRRLATFVMSFRWYLRNEDTAQNTPYLNHAERHHLAQKQHPVNALAKNLYQYVAHLSSKGYFSDTIQLTFEGYFTAFVEVIGGCERIKRTPIPMAYSVHLRHFLYLYLYSLPFTMLHEMGYWAIFVNALVFYALAGLKKIGEEIEDPFGRDINDLPLDAICMNICVNICELTNITTEELLEQKAQ